MGHHFTYEYCFDSDDCEVLCHVSYAFDNIAELENISVYPHHERRELAKSLMSKYPAEEYHSLSPSDITCPFAVKLNELFEGNLKVYWTKKFRLLLLFYTGLF